jgi:hypothetical protein
MPARPAKRRGADGVEYLVCAAELLAGVTPAPLAAQPLAVDQMSAAQVHPHPGTAQAVDRPRTGAPRAASGCSGVEELGHDAALRGYQGDGLVPLTRA